MLGSKKKVNIFVDKKHNRNELSWAKAEAYQDLVLEAASGNWKFSSCGILELNNSTQYETKASTQSQNLGRPTDLISPGVSSCFRENPKSLESLNSRQRAMVDQLTFPSPIKRG